MKQNIVLWQLSGFAVTTLAGTALHFLYGLTGDSLLVAPFSAVNESTWEHMKILFFPLFAYAIIQSFFFKGYRSFWCIKLRGILTGLFLIPALFYTLNGILGKTPDFVNIGIFFVSAAASFILERKLFKESYMVFEYKENSKSPDGNLETPNKKDSPRCISPKAAFLIICATVILFIVFTFIPPQIPLFEDPLSGAFGISI